MSRRCLPCWRWYWCGLRRKEQQMTETARMRKGYVDTPEGQIHYITAGSGGVPLILLHQNPSSARMWEAVIPGLAARGRQVVAFDTPGYGNSDAPAEEPDIPYYA